MTLSIASKGEGVKARMAVLLGLACLLGACSSSPREETTGSIARPQAQVGSATPMPPIIDAPSTVAAGQPSTQAVAYAPASRPVAYAPRPAGYAPRRMAYVPRAKACTCSAPQRYDVDGVDPACAARGPRADAAGQDAVSRPHHRTARNALLDFAHVSHPGQRPRDGQPDERERAIALRRAARRPDRGALSGYTERVGFSPSASPAPPGACARRRPRRCGRRSARARSPRW
jgi:hypothetical protein